MFPIPAFQSSASTPSDLSMPRIQITQFDRNDLSSIFPIPFLSTNTIHQQKKLDDESVMESILKHRKLNNDKVATSDLNQYNYTSDLSAITIRQPRSATKHIPIEKEKKSSQSKKFKIDMTSQNVLSSSDLGNVVQIIPTPSSLQQERIPKIDNLLSIPNLLATQSPANITRKTQLKSLVSPAIVSSKRPNPWTFDLSEPIFNSSTYCTPTFKQLPFNPHQPSKAEVILTEQIAKRDMISDILQNSQHCDSDQTETSTQANSFIGTPLVTSPSNSSEQRSEKSNKEIPNKALEAELINSELLSECMKEMSKAIGMNISNREGAVALLKKFEFDYERLHEEMKKNQAYYRSFFKANHKFLQNNLIVL